MFAIVTAGDAETVIRADSLAPLAAVAVRCVVPAETPVTCTVLPLPLIVAIAGFPIVQFAIGVPETAVCDAS
jgi:hypothetical protein